MSTPTLRAQQSIIDNLKVAVSTLEIGALSPVWITAVANVLSGAAAELKELMENGEEDES